MYFGGPQLMADSVGRPGRRTPRLRVHHRLPGFRGMVRAIGGVDRATRSSRSPTRSGRRATRRANNLNPFQALIFGAGPAPAAARRLRPLRQPAGAAAQHPAQGPRPRAASPASWSAGVLRVGEVHEHRPRAGRALPARPGGHRRSSPASCTGCVVQGRTGNAGGASVVFPNVGQARRLGNDARKDGTLDHGC